MANIQVLDQITIDKIAAGEVIERPASIVKELVENAVDAGATAVTVEIKEGGISFIRITDNGCGIPKEEVPVAFLRHSTSKIRSVEDLTTVASLGFRGEALSSIAAIAQVELLTKQKDSLLGTRYQIEGGAEKSLEDTGSRDGSTFLIRNIFYNTPARRKFLKTAMTEAGHVNELMIRLALSHPEISFEFINNGQTKLHTSGNGRLKDAIYHVFGREIAMNLLEVDSEMDGIKVTGFIGKPLISRGNRNYENYYINGRYVKSNIIAKAIEDGYKDFIMQHKYPFTVLHFEVNGADIDVNVHPTKMELRFSNQQKVYNFVYEAVKAAFQEKELIPKVELPEAKVPVPKAEVTSRMKQQVSSENHTTSAKTHSQVQTSAPTEERANNTVSQTKTQPTTIQPGNKTDTPPSGEKNLDYFMQKMRERVTSYHNQNSQAEVKDVYGIHRGDSQIDRIRETVNYGKSHETKDAPKQNLTEPARAEQLNLFEEKLLTKEAIKEHKIIGQLFDTYWLVEFHDQLYIIDQHAAHERVLYEKTLRGMKSREFTSQYLSPPIILNLTMQEEEVLNTNIDHFTSIGFEIEPFGGSSYAVRAVPDNLFSIAKKDLLIEMLDDLMDGISSTQAPDLIAEKIASMSCKAAVKGNARLSRAEVETLIGELLDLDNPYHCPHGRPTIIFMTKRELEKKFKRIV
ncbi:MAG: DNA mismatch repair endonuclease MutL [Tyzzerella sp.]|nr:DNA mismatch repair endonuclease MutL [Tyzzerella sp.]